MCTKTRLKNYETENGNRVNRVRLSKYHDVCKVDKFLRMGRRKLADVLIFIFRVDDENLVIPELHVTSISGHEMLSEPFEAGLQMLKTMERQQ